MRGRVLTVTLLLTLLAAPIAAQTQQAVKVARIGWLGLDPAGALHLRAAFLEGLRDLGYVEGRNLMVESRYTGVNRKVRRAHSPHQAGHSLNANPNQELAESRSRIALKSLRHRLRRP